MDNALSFEFFIYSRPAGERRFALTDLARGTVGLGKFYAPRYRTEHLEPLRREHQLAHDQQRPAVAHHIQRMGAEAAFIITRFLAYMSHFFILSVVFYDFNRHAVIRSRRCDDWWQHYHRSHR